MLLKFQSFPVLGWIIGYLLDAVPVTASIYQLPVVPWSPYTIDDVIVLPWDGENIDVNMSRSDNTSVARPLTLTFEEGFRFNNKNISNEFKIENGIQIMTSDKATVTISLHNGQMRIPSIDMCSEHHVFDKDSISLRHLDFIFFQPIHFQTFANICITDSVGEMTSMDNPEIIKEGIIATVTNCTRLETIYPQGLFLKKVSSFHILEISANQAICVFQGYATNLSPVLANRKDFTKSLTTVQPIVWSFASPILEKSNTYVVISQHVEREANLYILSSTDTSINISTGGNVTQYFTTANTRISVDVSLQEKHVTTISSNNDISLRCSYKTSNNDTCHVIPLQTFDFTNASLSSNSNYTWIYYTSDLMVTVLCHGSFVYDLVNNNESVDVYDINRVIVSEQIYQVLFIYNINPGLYKLSLNCSINRCAVIYSNCENKTCNSIKQGVNESEPELVNDPLETTNLSDMLLSAGISDKLINTSSESINNKTTSIETSNMNTSSEPNTLPKKSPPETIPVSKSNVENISQIKLTTESVNSNEQYLDIQVQPIKHDVNDRFKVVVDILHSKDGPVNILPSSRDTDTSKYLYTDEFSGYMGVSDNKSFTAIFASLGAALLAVIVLILSFLLKEIFSRRHQRRNTRIRPFVSYY